MRTFATTVGALGLIAALAPAPASAQYFQLRPDLTKSQFEDFTGELGSVLRSRQLGDATTVEKGKIDLSVQFANTAIDTSKSAWNYTLSDPTASNDLGRAMSFPRVLARFGVSDRVDIGAWGGIDPHARYGLVGVDTKIALVKQGPARPVSVAVRPSFASLIGPSDVWAATMGVDLSVSRAFGALSPYAGVAASSSGAIERSRAVHLDPVSAGEAFSYAGVSYHWRSLTLSAEVDNGNRTSYGFSLGTRF